MQTGVQRRCHACMTPRILLLLTLLTTMLAAPAVADALPWAPGHYTGKVGTMRSSESRGRVDFTVTRTRARVNRLVIVLVCMEGQRERFVIKNAGSGRLRPGPAGAGVSIVGRRTIDGWDVDWDLVGGVQGSTFRGNIGGSAVRESENCTLIGDFRSRRRG